MRRCHGFRLPGGSRSCANHAGCHSSARNYSVPVFRRRHLPPGPAPAGYPDPTCAPTPTGTPAPARMPTPTGMTPAPAAAPAAATMPSPATMPTRPVAPRVSGSKIGGSGKSSKRKGSNHQQLACHHTLLFRAPHFDRASRRLPIILLRHHDRRSTRIILCPVSQRVQLLWC